ncbi:MAG: hypothetical protein NVSMB9_25850 [Isosphaeraceae bacterium]
MVEKDDEANAKRAESDEKKDTVTGLIRQVGGRSTGSIHGNAVRSKQLGSWKISKPDR